MADATGWKADGNAEKTSREGQRGDMCRNSASIAQGSFGSYENSRHVEGDAVNKTSRSDLGNVTRKPSIKDIEDSEDWDELCNGLYLCSAGQLHRERSVYKGVLQQDSGDLQDIVVKLLERRKDTVAEDARELDILDRLSYHPHIVEILCSGKCKYGGPKFFIAMEPCLQNLAEYIDDKDNSFDLSKATKFFYQTVSAINYIHDNKIVHRDLKPSNILITFNRENIKVSDFGISRQLDPDRSDKTVSYKGAGTSGFKSPETLLNLDYSKIGLEADIYCLAICGCYIMTHGGHPFGTDSCYWEPNIRDNKDLNLSIVHKFPQAKAHKNEQLVSLLTKMLAHDQKDRPRAIEVLGDEFFEEVLHRETSTDGIGIEAPSVQPAGSPKQPEVYQDFDISDSCGESSDEDTDIEESVHLSNTLLMFPNKKLSPRRNVVVGEMCSNTEFENRSCVIKFDSDQIIMEATALLKLGCHSNVISLLDFGSFNDYWMNNSSYLVLERCHDLNLENYLLRDDIVPGFDINRGLNFCKQIINGMKFVHENLIIHKDLKPSNILLTHDLESVKIADFGSSQEVTSPSSMVPSPCVFGTLGYRPPESLLRSHVSLKSDIFSLGVVFCFLLSNGKSPFGPNSDSWDYNTLHSVDIPILLVPNPITTAHLVKSMLNKSRQCRPSVAQVDLHFCWSGKERLIDTDYPFEEESEDSIIVESSSSQAEKNDLDAPISKFLQAVDKHEEILKLDSVWSGKDVPANAILHPSATTKDSSRAILETSEPGNGRAIGLREWELENELVKVAEMEANSRGKVFDCHFCTVDETISDSDTVGNAEQLIENEPEKLDRNFNDVMEEPEMSLESSDVVEAVAVDETRRASKESSDSEQSDGNESGTLDKEVVVDAAINSEVDHDENISGSAINSGEFTEPSKSTRLEDDNPTDMGDSDKCSEATGESRSNKNSDEMDESSFKTVSKLEQSARNEQVDENADVAVEEPEKASGTITRTGHGGGETGGDDLLGDAAIRRRRQSTASESESYEVAAASTREQDSDFAVDDNVAIQLDEDADGIAAGGRSPEANDKTESGDNKGEEEMAVNRDKPPFAPSSTESDVAATWTGSSGDFPNRCREMKAGEKRKRTGGEVSLRIAIFSKRSSGQLACTMWTENKMPWTEKEEERQCSRWYTILQDFERCHFKNEFVHPSGFSVCQSEKIKIQLELSGCQRTSAGHEVYIHGDTDRELLASNVAETPDHLKSEYFLICPLIRRSELEYVTVQFSIKVGDRSPQPFPFHVDFGDEEEIEKLKVQKTDAQQNIVNFHPVTDTAIGTHVAGGTVTVDYKKGSRQTITPPEHRQSS